MFFVLGSQILGSNVRERDLLDIVHRCAGRGTEGWGWLIQQRIRRVVARSKSFPPSLYPTQAYQNYLNKRRSIITHFQADLDRHHNQIQLIHLEWLQDRDSSRWNKVGHCIAMETRTASTPQVKPKSEAKVKIERLGRVVVQARKGSSLRSTPVASKPRRRRLGRRKG
jgi:hypothetical protein